MQPAAAGSLCARHGSAALPVAPRRRCCAAAAAGAGVLEHQPVAARPYRPRRRGLTVCADAAPQSIPAPGTVTEIRICTGKVCKKQGSEQVVRFGEQLGLPGLTITAGGCLGNCGNGPNMVLIPHGTILRHVSTPADLAQALRAFCGADIGDSLLRATELRLAGNALAMAGDLQAAVARYQEALALTGPAGPGAYLIHSNLSAAHLQAGRKGEALDAAEAAVAGAPRGFHKAHVRLVDAFYALGMFAEAETAVEAAIAADPTFKGIPEFRIIMNALRGAKKRA